MAVLETIIVGGGASGGGSPVVITGNALASSVQSAQVTIATTGTAVQFPSIVCVNGGIVTAHSLNSTVTSANIGTVGGASVSQTTGGFLPPGAGSSVGCQNANEVWVNGTIGDRFSIVVT